VYNATLAALKATTIAMDIRKNTLINCTLYGLALVGTIIGGIRQDHIMVYICKPALLVILSSWFFFNSRRVGDRFTLLIQAGLFFSLIGDVALMFDHKDPFNFLIGLGAFMIAQLCYALAFAQNISDAGPGGNILVPVVLSAGVMAYGFFFAYDLLPYVDDVVAVPVIIYACAITLMGIGAVCRFSRTYLRSFVVVLLGSIFFIASDSILAVNRFMKPMDHAQWSVMLTYGIGQFLIAAGALAHVLDPEEIRRKAALST
jgi:uncharacterized membrane protein YhhN